MLAHVYPSCGPCLWYDLQNNYLSGHQGFVQYGAQQGYYTTPDLLNPLVEGNTILVHNETMVGILIAGRGGTT